MKAPILKIFIICLSIFTPILLYQAVYGQITADTELKTKAEQLSGDSFVLLTKTRQGARIYAVRRPSKQMLKAIDRGLSDLFAVAKRNGYRNHLKHSDYVIFIAKADRQTDSDGNYIPNFAIPVAQYAGTDYDKGGYMYAAGMVLSNSQSAFMVAENQKKLEQVSEVVRFEGEHLVLYHNDRRRYNETADHSRHGGHPILK